MKIFDFVFDLEKVMVDMIFFIVHVSETFDDLIFILPIKVARNKLNFLSTLTHWVFIRK